MSTPNKITDVINISTDGMKTLPSSPKRIYLDYQATTPIDPRVTDAMLPYLTSKFGNPHSRTHSYGWQAEAAVEKARRQVADLINCDAKDILFTSGATESNNMALKGVCLFKMKENKRSEGENKKPVHIITLQTEHKSILDVCRNLEELGCEVTYLKVDKDGLIDLNELRNSIRDNTAMVSVMAVNNEIGVIQPLREIGKICKEKGVIFHCDAAQAVGKIPIDVAEMNIDMLSISGHKMYGPKWIGALYIRRRPRIRIYPIVNGGGQERGLRSGTLPPPLIVGLGKAAEISAKEMKRDHQRIKELSARLYNYLKNKLPKIVKNGSEKDSKWYPGCLNLSFSFVEGEGLLMGLKRFALSSGSACTSSSLEPSYVLRAIGTGDEMAHSSLRFGIGRFTTEEEIDEVGKETVNVVTKLRNMSPLFEMDQQGIDLKSIKWSAE
ncbi:Cysteine desulfurase, mitosomal [Astathelohania contejeani]|uniref:cysteine desulfurase n=1 Tax=Astathelohania contejeani TaxID=164912 RepID=A0ABQ7HZQ6_9MICR|nr:Cysteine desulfurase, mitosomal [Thelohania contejeani]